MQKSNKLRHLSLVKWTSTHEILFILSLVASNYTIMIQFAATFAWKERSCPNLNSVFASCIFLSLKFQVRHIRILSKVFKLQRVTKNRGKQNIRVYLSMKTIKSSLYFSIEQNPGIKHLIQQIQAFNFIHGIHYR